MLSKKNILFIALLLTVLIIAIGTSMKYYQHSTYNDLKTRVVGSRLADENKDAYFYKWNPSTDILYLLNPNEKSGQIVTGNTVTPPILALFKKLHQAPLHYIVRVWLWFSYALFFIILFLFYKYSNQKNGLLLLCISSFFLLTAAWQMHIIKGQVYILYTTLAILSLYFYCKKNTIVSGFIAGLVTSFRLPIVLLFSPLLFKSKKYTLSFIAGFIVSVLFSIAMYGNSIWTSYFKAMQEHSKENSGTITEIPTINFTAPNYMEGVPNKEDSVIVTYQNKLNPDIFSIQKLLVQYKLPSSTIVLGLLYSIISLLIIALLYNRDKLFYRKEYKALLLSSLLYFLVDYFLPAPRFNYNFAQFLIVIGVALFYNIKIPILSKVLLCLGVFLNIVKLHWIPECYSAGEVLCVIGIAITLFYKEEKKENEIFANNRIA